MPFVFLDNNKWEFLAPDWFLHFRASRKFTLWFIMKVISITIERLRHVHEMSLHKTTHPFTQCVGTMTAHECRVKISSPFLTHVSCDIHETFLSFFYSFTQDCIVLRSHSTIHNNAALRIYLFSRFLSVLRHQS